MPAKAGIQHVLKSRTVGSWVGEAMPFFGRPCRAMTSEAEARAKLPRYFFFRRSRPIASYRFTGAKSSVRMSLRSSCAGGPVLVCAIAGNP